MLQLLLIKKMREGKLSEDEKTKIVQVYKSFCESIAKKYALRKRYSDYIAEGYAGIARAIALAPQKMYDDDADKWIRHNIVMAIRDFRVKDHLIPYSKSTQTVKTKKGTPLVGMIAHELNENDFIEPKKCHEYSDYLEYIGKAVSNDLEHEIVELRKLGYKDKEIAEILEISVTYVHNLRSAVRTRFERIVKEHEV